MAKFNEKKSRVVSKPTETNFMGEKAFKMEDKEEFISTIMTTFLGDSYYEKENTTIERIKSLIDKLDPLFVAKAAIYARNEGKLRSVSHLIAGELAHKISGKEWAKNFYNKIVVRPDDMSEIVSYYKKMVGKSIPNAMKKGFRLSLEELDAYQIDKYKMKNKSISLIDLVRLFHPTHNEKNAKAYDCLVKGESLKGLYDSKILEHEMSGILQTDEKLSEDEKNALKSSAIKSVLYSKSGMPIFNLLRNLCNIIKYCPDAVDEVCKQLTNEHKIENSKILPFRFVVAYSEVENLLSKNKKIKFEKNGEDDVVTKVLNSLEKAMSIACVNLPKFEGNLAILVDDSGSMRGGYYYCNASVSDITNSTRTSHIAHLFSSMMVEKNDNVYVASFGDKLIQMDVKRDIGIIERTKHTYKEGGNCGFSTESGIYEFMRNVIKEKTKIDNVIVFSDCQIGCGHTFTDWYGSTNDERSKGFNSLFNEFKKINPNANFIVVNLKQYGNTTVFDNSRKIINIAGWSEKIFDTLENVSLGWGGMIQEIEKIQL